MKTEFSLQHKRRGSREANTAELLQNCPNRFALAVLQPFIEQNEVGAEQLLELNTIIRAAREDKVLIRDRKIVWEGLAIFALYVYFEVTDLGDITEHLRLARPTVKRWISAIYGSLELAQSGFPDRVSRRRALRLKAQHEGYVKYTSWLLRTL